MNPRFLILLVVFTVLTQVSQAGAQIIGEIKLNISGSGLVYVSEDFTISGSEKTASFIVPTYGNMKVHSAGVSVPYDSRIANGGMAIDLNLEDLPLEVRMRNVLMEYETQHLTSKNGSIWSISFATKTTSRKTIIKIYFPKNSTIISLKPRDVLFSVDRDSLWLYPQEESFNFTCDYEYAGGPVIPPVEVERDMTMLFVSILTLIALLVLIVLVYYLLKKRASSKVVGRLEMEKEEVSTVESNVEGGDAKKAGSVGGIEFEFKTASNTPTIKSTVFNVLDDEEKNIVSFIRERGPEDVTQAFIYKTTRIPKSSLSEILKRLERRNIVECRREGRVNWIRLKKWILD
ncbi:MAG: hypothetical protein FJY77_01795 [Candidatus Altiarchaeales archaeon]|nr:hypothetical protein [Candidatus Altiarchaeales archaeon]